VPVSLVVTPSHSFGRTVADERRGVPRVELTLTGKYMLRSRNESPCWTVDLSPSGIAVLGFDKGMIGERIVASFSHIGWVEGMIARNFDNCFAFALQLGAAKRRKFAETLAWLTSHHIRGTPDRRSYERVKTYRRRLALATCDGQSCPAVLMDVSAIGAALYADFAPPLGSSVIVGRQTPARVVRHLEGGIAVAFDKPFPEGAFDVDRARI
jgi:hypothetical protein